MNCCICCGVTACNQGPASDGKQIKGLLDTLASGRNSPSAMRIWAGTESRSFRSILLTVQDRNPATPQTLYAFFTTGDGLNIF
jgi:hypothetical protein